MEEQPDAGLLAGLDAITSYGVVAIDSSGRVRRWNAGAAKLTGFPRDQAMNSLLAELIAEGPEEFTPAFLKELSAGESELGLWIRRADGTRFWGRTTAVVSASLDGRPPGYVLLFRDATSLKETTEELERSRTMFERILSIASDAVISIDESQRIIFFNQGAERIFGYTRDEVLGRELSVLIPEGSRSAHMDRVREFGQSPVTARVMGERGEIRGRRKTGEIFPAEASISKLDLGGEKIFTAVLRDVTERRMAEEALSRQAAELARSNADLERFAYVASHDLQEPLRMVASYTQLLARRYRGRLDDDADEFIGFAVDGVNRMQALINDLLSYSRVDRRGGEFRRTPLTKTLREVLATLGPALDEAGATITNDPLPVVTGDRTQLSQLFQNLIQNAVKFRRPGVHPRIHIGVEDLGDMWQLSVRDNGIGIAEEFLERIFIIFQRLHNRADYPGTGIGLAICKKIVERHGGRIWVESVVDEGSTFYFTLPKDADAE